jgi:hypothetical protein
MNSPHTHTVLLAASAVVFYFWGQVEKNFDKEIEDTSQQRPRQLDRSQKLHA